ncbi:fluoride efflux transporter CrcB [Solimonas sp. K1W22B-7]|uniref:fluoride efflux transporter CrcB n=1 Tax=Solimonas sp. K1W22B-7 TaxID=2303331 RepID=UPI000E3335D5|nr:fluoride efflux transporter CrcB [Solimonas sp. K1W22B-7]AXQ29150.1 fluoride efflux transporter CrcB [Solimonas sp. K1W22B-7]
MNAWLAVLLGGGVGSVCRYGVVRLATAAGATLFPWGTLAVNVVGSLLAGVAYALLAERMNAAPEWRALAMAGFLGGFTTFSAFSLETVRLAEDGHVAAALSNMALNLVLCLAACALGLLLVRRYA